MFAVRLIAVGALLAGGPAVAQEPAPAPEGAPSTVTGDKLKPEPKPKLVCKETTTGTVLRKRICLPKSEWARAEKDSGETLKAMRDWQRVRCGFGSIC
jgi:hypothetical protein